jgi:hypothetical protein
VGEAESSEATEIRIHQRQFGYFELSVPGIRLYVRCLFAGKQSRISDLRSYYGQAGSNLRKSRFTLLLRACRPSESRVTRSAFIGSNPEGAAFV